MRKRLQIALMASTLAATSLSLTIPLRAADGGDDGSSGLTATTKITATDEHGRTALHAREYATLDRAGRIQLPREMTTRLRMRHRVQLQEEPDHIGIWPDRAADQEGDHRPPES